MSADIIPVTADQYAVRGELNFTTVPHLHKLGSKLLTDQNSITFTFQDVSNSDSSGLTLLTAWTRQARRSGKQVKFTNLPAQLLDIAKLSGLSTILPIQL